MKKLHFEEKNTDIIYQSWGREVLPKLR